MNDLTIITREESTLDIFHKQLRDIFKNNIKIQCLYLKDPFISSKRVQSDLILVSGYAQLEEGKEMGLIKNENKVLVAKRTLNIQNINGLRETVELPEQSLVLFADNTRPENLELLYDIENLLARLNINHIKLVPYVPYHNQKNHNETLLNNLPDIAITFGMNYLVPSNVKKIIDLGQLQIDIPTIIKIVQSLNYKKEIETEPLQFIPPLVSLTKEVVQSARSIRDTNIKLQGVIESSNEGIVVLNDKREILLCNTKANEILNSNNSQLLLKPVGDALPEAKYLNINESAMVNIQNNDFLVTIRRINPDSNYGYAVILSPTTSIHEMEFKVRRHLYSKNHRAKYKFTDIITENNKTKELIELAKGIARTEFNVLIYGESGTGKELFANAIHNASDRFMGPFIGANVTAFPDNLIESELFGYDDGAFTGSRKGGKPGLFELADHGTIFLDEIGDLSMSLQTKLLRVLQEREIRRVGSSKIIPIDVRIIAATNRNLLEMVKNGSFREDLYYRLYVLPLIIPPLRERKEDIKPVLNHYLNKFNLSIQHFDENIQSFLLQYNWPGNYRQIENFAYYLGCLTSIYGLKDINFTHVEQYFGDEMPSKSLPNNDFFNSYNYIKTQCDISDLISILKSLINKENNKGQNLKTLCEIIFEDKHVSLHWIRKRINILKEHGFVEIGRTRQGTKITNKGIQFISFFNNQIEKQGNL